MSASPAAVVNQRLYYCRLQLDYMESLSSDPGASPAVFLAAQESLVYHLFKAYQAYLLEIATKCGEPEVRASSASKLVAIMEAKGHSSAELEQLRVLESRESWLSSLLKYFHECDYGAIRATASQSPLSNSEIDIVNVDSKLANKPEVKHKDIFNQLKELIDSQRGTMEEW